jgi:hypothetical protein
MIISTSIQNGHLRILINSQLHLSLRVRGLLAVHAYSWAADSQWDIEFVYEKGAVVRCRYHRADVWEQIMAGISFCELV